jgi:nucleotide-binding universal stress UspA family protein
MANVDQFESIFRASVKERLEYRHIPISSILIITDLSTDEATAFQKRIQLFLSVLGPSENLNFFIATGNEFQTTEELLQLTDGYTLDLICSYRNLHSSAWQFPHSLGEHLDVLIQKTTTPVLILPHPNAGYMAEHAMQDLKEVMVVSDLVAINHDLINYAVRLTQSTGTLFLSHVENQYIFDRYMDAIGKIDVIDTELARTRLAEQLLKEPEDYFLSCTEILKEHGITLDIRSMVRFGHGLQEYRRQIEARKLDLLVMHAKDERQQAMNSIAYPLAIELRQIPLLMI